ncbi:MAG: flagellar brake protein [Rhodocyclaceae bacterium]|jgi:c-di-GMP-binding flagellar brake protein YcgR|nr:flagellar brake protein [Rhodocyclaceae bacterium]MDP3032989.1 flagellar brake protein [Rhodocyclaceae bacterium]
MTTQTISADELERFTTKNRREVLFYLHQLINDGERISVSFNEGKDTVLTMLLHINEAENMLIFDWGGSETANRKLMQSERNYFVCTPHGVKNQFMCGMVYETIYRKRRAFATRLPDYYTRLQRREFFRLVLPMTRRPTCIIKQGEKPVMELSVVDLSIGGIAAELSGSQLAYEIGQTLPYAQIELKGVGTLEVTLEIRDKSTVQRGGKVADRIGCRFINLSQAVENQLQRFITSVQREERARLGG